MSERFLSLQEKEVFKPYLEYHRLDDGIWGVFACLFEAGTEQSRPLVLKAYRNDELEGACILVRCRKYGRSLFNNRFLSSMLDMLGIPCHLWVRFGCCMDMLSNPGFVRDPASPDEALSAMARHIKENTLVSIVTDYPWNEKYYHSPSILPALPHALIDIGDMETLTDFTGRFKNLKRKMRVFTLKGGEYLRVDNILSVEQAASLEKCFVATAEQSVFYLPYQDLYLSAALHTSRTYFDNVHYFIAMLDGKFIGYQAALKTGNHLNALHGAFDRHLRTTHHAYDILFVRMTEFALEHGLQSIDFGAVLNTTKQKMVNKTLELSYFLLSKYRLVQWAFSFFLKITKIQGRSQMKFR